MTVKDVVAERFRQLCAQRGIKYNELANLSGITPSTVYGLLDVRHRDISITTIKKIVRRAGYHAGRVFRSA